MASVDSRLEIETEATTSLDFNDFDIQANKFLKFAEADLQQGTTQGLVNALSNAKRAIDCQVDTVLGCFGLLARRNFPQKINVLNELGIVTPRIVRKVVTARNYLEHKYINPKQEQVEDAVDVATLFVVLLDRGLRHFWCDFKIVEVADATDEMDQLLFHKELQVHYDNEKKHFELWGGIYDEPANFRSKARKVKTTTSAVIVPKEKGFTELARLSFALDSLNPEIDLKNYIRQFVQIFSS